MAKLLSNLMVCFASLVLVCIDTSDAAVLPAGAAFTAPPFAFAGAAPIGPFTAPLAVSSQQRLDYFNNFNAAFIAPPPPARLIATPAGLAALPAARFFAAGPSPARFFAAPATAPFIF